MTRYRILYVRHSPYVGLGSTEAIKRYGETGWPGLMYPTFPQIPYELIDKPPALFTINTLWRTHIQVTEYEATDLEAVFTHFQADMWPEAEYIAFGEFTRSLGLTHASMSMGDIVVDLDTNIAYECEGAGWRPLSD